MYPRFNRRFAKEIASSVLLFLCFQCAIAEDADSHIRLRYDNDNAPPSVVFELFIRRLFSTSLKPHDNGAFYLGPGVTEGTNIEEVFDYFVALWLELDKEIGDSQKRMLCPSDTEKPEGKEIFEVFDAFDDVNHAIHHKYYAIAKAELAVDNVFDLDRALEGYEISFVQIWQYHDAAYGGSVEKAEEAARAICSNPRQWTFRKHHGNQE